MMISEGWSRLAPLRSLAEAACVEICGEGGAVGRVYVVLPMAAVIPYTSSSCFTGSKTRAMPRTLLLAISASLPVSSLIRAVSVQSGPSRRDPAHVLPRIRHSC